MSYQLSLSFELICLLDWLINEGEDELKKIIVQAVKNDFLKKIDDFNDQDYELMAENLHEVVMKFAVFLEDALFEELAQEAKKTQGSNRKISKGNPQKLLAQNLYKDFEKKLDSKGVWLGAQKVRRSSFGRKKISQKNEIEKEIFKKLLKNWRPASNETVN